MGTNAILSGCMKAEKSAASIYKKLMTKFPEQKDFWQDLFKDETEHLSFLNDVKSLGLIKTMRTVDVPPSTTIINETLQIADDLIKKMSSKSLTLKKALTMVLKLEESMAETYTNKIIAKLISCENAPSYKKVVADEKKHVNKIKKMMKAV